MVKALYSALFASLALATFSCDKKGPEPAARANLTSILRDSIGAGTDPQVAFIVIHHQRTFSIAQLR